MGVVLTVMNMKGGVGKTTVAMHVGGALGLYKWKDKDVRKVLLIDYDPQFNLSQSYLASADYFPLEKSKKTILSVLQDDPKKLDPYKIQVPGSTNPPPVSSLARNIWKTALGARLDVIPSTLDLMYLALGKADSQVGVIEERFSAFIADCKSQYDLVVIDCHPAGSLMTKTALGNSDHVLIPVVPQKYAVRGIGLMLDFINAKKHGSNGPKPHILFNRVPRTGPTPEELEIRSNAKYKQYCLTNTLKNYSAFSEPQEGKGFVWLSSKPYSQQAKRNMQVVSYEVGEKIGVW
ncbi:ParA family protein [Luteimonas composti]|uniref:ParA family protein n=1 Tax=Luteimonas composti TaxID=398257 RepID=A0ABT6MQG5_9GAMM|nr:ParA family protein [Luteimonas composti]MDH7452843.1 ParA family protein [Luteimonas composti]